MLAQAVLQLIQLVAQQAAVNQQIGLNHQASIIMQIISGIPTFRGIAEELDLLLVRMEEAHNLITTSNLDEGMKRTIRDYMLSRVDLRLLLDLAVTFEHSSNEVKNS